MKVNSIGIQSYQQIPKRDDAAAQAAREQEQAATVTIEPKSPVSTSSLAIKSKSGNYADSLSNEERRAMELLFSRFKDSGRFGMNGRPETDNSDAGLGQIVDIKI